MQVSQRKFSRFQVVTSDYAIQLIGLFLIGLPIVYFLARFNPNEARRLQPGEETLFLKVAGGLLIVGIFQAIWKLRTVKRIFEYGVEVIGTVTDITGYRYTSITSRYLYHRKVYLTVETMGLTKRTRSLKIGSQVVLVVNATNPRQALIRDLSISDEDFEQNFPEFQRLSANTTPVLPVTEAEVDLRSYIDKLRGHQR